MTKVIYRRDLRAAFRGFWVGIWDENQFLNEMFLVIKQGLTRAWINGAKQVGIQPDEITPAEQVKLTELIFKEYAYVPGLMTYLIPHRRENGGLLRTFFARVEYWVTRYDDVYNQAILNAREDPKLKWVFTPGKDHCSTCAKLNGKVKRSSTWRESGWQPQSRALA